MQCWNLVNAFIAIRSNIYSRVEAISDEGGVDSCEAEKILNWNLIRSRQLGFNGCVLWENQVCIQAKVILK